MASHSASRLLLLAGVVATAGCRYAGPYVDTRREIVVTYAAGPSTVVYAGEAKVGTYRFVRCEGEAEETVRGGSEWRLEPRAAGPSRDVVQPFSGARIELTPLPDGRLQMEHGRGPASVLVFVSGSWDDLALGKDVVLRFADPSWQEWIRATQDAWFAILDEYRGRVIPNLQGGEMLTDAEVTDVLVHEKPLVRANRIELLVFFEALQMEGAFAVRTQRKDPRYRWWAYGWNGKTERTVVAIAGAIAEATAYAAILSLRVCAECARCR